MESVLKMGSKKVAEGKEQITEYIKEQNASASKEERQTGKVNKIVQSILLVVLSLICSCKNRMLLTDR